MSGTTTGADQADAPTPEPPAPDETALDAVDPDADAATDAVDEVDAAEPADETNGATTTDDDAAAESATDDADTAEPGAVAVEEELGFAVPTWYVLFCALPFAAAFLVPITVIYRAQNSVPPMSATSAAWLGVATGWVLWLIGTAGWLLGPVVLAGARRRAPVAWEWWHRTTRAWVVVVLAWGLIASLSVVAVAFLLGRLSA